jgi:hypothetical protein
MKKIIVLSLLFLSSTCFPLLKPSPIINDYPESSPKVQEFIRNEIGIPEDVAIKNAPFYGVLFKTLYIETIPGNKKSNLEHLLDQQKSWSRFVFKECAYEIEEKLSEQKAILFHEKHHLTSKDNKKTLIASSLIPPATYYIAAKTKDVLKKLTGINSSQKFLWLRKISFCTSLLCINTALLQKYSRHLEQQADEAIPNDKKLLQGAQNRLKRELNTKKSSVMVKSFLTQIFSSHPSLEKRIARFQERIRQLEKDVSN